MPWCVLLALAWAEPIRRADQAPGSVAQVERGRVVFGNCSGCHGPKGEGMVGMAPRLNSGTWLAIVSNRYLRSTLQKGRPGTDMIAWGAAMPAADLDAVVAYIRSWQTWDALELDESPLRGDAADGAALYAQNCARCHGEGGAGYAAQGPGTAIGRRGFLDEASNGMIRAIVQNGKTDTPMQPFAEGRGAPYAVLEPEQIDSIIAYLRASAW